MALSVRQQRLRCRDDTCAVKLFDGASLGVHTKKAALGPLGTYVTNGEAECFIVDIHERIEQLILFFTEVRAHSNNGSTRFDDTSISAEKGLQSIDEPRPCPFRLIRAHHAL